MTPPTKKYANGRLVQLDDETWTVVYDEPGKSQAQHKDRKRPRKELTYELYLSKDRTKVLGPQSEVVSDQVLVVKLAYHNNYEQAFIRFMHQGAVWSAYTLSGEEQRLVAKETKFGLLDQGLRKDTRPCASCGVQIQKIKGMALCGECMEKKSQEEKRKRSSELQPCAAGCGRLVRKENKTGYCRSCYKSQGDFYAVSGGFNPFYGRWVSGQRRNRDDGNNT